MKQRPILAITMGDPAGIGSEIIVKTLSKKEYYDLARPLVIGDADRMKESLGFVEENLEINVVSLVEEAKFTYGTIDVLHIDIEGAATVPYGKVNAIAGKAAVNYIFKSIEMANNREVDAVVTGPINKESMHLAGYKNYPGHTEIFAEKTNTKDYAMMLYTDGYYVIHVSTHCSLREACDRATKTRVKKVIELAHDMIKTYSIDNPLIAVAGLNPHSGEGGAFGDEEIKEIIPAIEEAQKEGIEVTGPIPPDSIFYRAMKGQFKVIVVMYHDQGHIPVKVINFEDGVNVTLGLPIIRTSVDHGTAFGKAGKGTASPASMEAAYKLAAEMALKKFYLK
ncbi:MAG: 4-phospho-D-threonate 3-dehydrogenase / 4-phospho-D-erythronate 3-dehydrogenase [Clostridia bacterium]|jgi:4-hydroxythreonine-4-phosphate dehydrogenase|nr:4-phospho-D-threonate 3-dehydrogenase / 4-phospho-D-erythronate 3-dehydrogenase [Clostridia bacterium]MDN5322709.1 4-phospho-D-threonate 3-dehydrogenase / 4-phospho-D-erythronate 3-dehydrogenase [Clostridia bacterium]